jgi:hypothetical protein
MRKLFVLFIARRLRWFIICFIIILLYEIFRIDLCIGSYISVVYWRTLNRIFCNDTGWPEIIFNVRFLFFSANTWLVCNWLIFESKIHDWCRTGAASRRNNMIPTLNLKCKLIWQIWGDKKFLSSIGRKWNGSRYLVFWSLGTLTGLRDRVRGLVA